ncbi:unnamed protein product [Thelazia callipaeda]|uniref:Uncharacterized protein n=1 Tax=Thelazia callipaeda TaxID=103827 RepID=A0A0N5D952_THECL|nr:unnamed protein product [Thelazia callipaeda]
MLCSSWLAAAINNVRSRRREGQLRDEIDVGMPSRCLSTPQSLNRSIPCVYESSEFTPVRSTSYIDGLPYSDDARTAVVGPNNIVHRGREGPSYDYEPYKDNNNTKSSANKGNNCTSSIRTYCSSDIARTYTSPTAPIARHDSDIPPSYHTHRRSTHPEDGMTFNHFL